MTWWEYIFSQLTTEQWLIVLAAMAIYLYVFVNYLVRKAYFKVAYLDQGEGFDIFDCKIVGNEIEFLPEKQRKLYGVIPLQRRQIKEPIRKGIAAGAKVMVKGPRTWKVYFATYNSPVTIDPAQLYTMAESTLSLGHDAIKGFVQELVEAGRTTSKKDWMTYILLIVVGMFIHILLQKLGLPI